MLHERAPEEYPPNLGLTKPEFVRQDLDVPRLIAQAEACFLRNGHVKVVCFWGIGWKGRALPTERLAMSHLALLTAHLQRTFIKGIRLRFLLTDNHAFANEIPDGLLSSYISDVECLASEFGIATTRISTVYSLAREQILSLEPSPEETALYEGLRRQFEGSARNVHEVNFEQRALRYFILRYRERMAIANCYSDSIYLCFESNDRSLLRPDLPHIRTYVLPTRKWRKFKPWFLKY